MTTTEKRQNNVCVCDLSAKAITAGSGSLEKEAQSRAKQPFAWNRQTPSWLVSAPFTSTCCLSLQVNCLIYSLPLISEKHKQTSIYAQGLADKWRITLAVALQESTLAHFACHSLLSYSRSKWTQFCSWSSSPAVCFTTFTVSAPQIKIAPVDLVSTVFASSITAAVNTATHQREVLVYQKEEELVRATTSRN